MKKLFLFNLIAVILILSLQVVSADVTVGEYVKYGIINVTTGTLIDTGIPVNDFNVIGFVCNSANCAGVSTSLWGGSVLHSIGNFISLTYPTSLLSPFGYGVYLYKDGYIPFELSANWAGTGDAGNFTRYLTKKSSCTANISSFNYQNTTSSLIVNATINAPIHNSGPLNYIPNSIKSQYQSTINANIELKKNNVVTYSEIKSLTIDFSGSKDVGFTLPLSGSGSYHVKFYTGANDSDTKCILTLQDVREFDFNISTLACVENWNCLNWSSCVSGQQTRTCTDLNSCGATIAKPSTNQSCTPSCTPNIVNTSWSSWSNIGFCNIHDKQNQSRYKIWCDQNNCGVVANATSYESQEVSCSYCNENITSFYASWSSCLNSSQTRIKYFLDNNYNSCCALTGLSSDCHINNGSYSNITESQSCQVGCIENWNCSIWGTCVNNSQTRTCTDLNSCGTEINKPLTIQSCNLESKKCTSCGKLKVFGNISIEESTESQDRSISRGVSIGNLTLSNNNAAVKSLTGISLACLVFLLFLSILLLLLLILLVLLSRRR